MKKNYSLFLLLAAVLFAGRTFAQTTVPCATDDMREKYKLQHPEIAVYEKQLESEITNYLSKKDLSNFRTTSVLHNSDSDYYDIPVAVHVMHEYGAEVINDKSIYALISEMNRFYSLQFDNSAIVPEFKPYIGRPHFRFHLATIDPNGQPTKGITHHFTYLATGGDDQAKMDQWPPTSYMNIWFEQRIGAAIAGGIIVAYATQPPEAAALPFYDGIICNYSFINDTVGHAGGSIDHETGHIMNLYHTFGMTNNTMTAGQSPVTGNCDCTTCSDLVDDTPPTGGQLGGCNLYDTICATNYFKLYPSSVSGVDSLVDYPDTSNEQNIMNYADCSKLMFTKGQVARMHAAINSPVAGRSNLWSPSNLIFTGVVESDSVTFVPTPDLPPIVDYAVKNSTGSASSGTYTKFTCPGVQLAFINESYQDTVTSVNWTFSNSAVIPETTGTATTIVKNNFNDPGWVSVTIAATGNNSGTTTATDSRAVFVADNTGTPGDGYFMEFNNSDTAKWPMFNYYNNEFKWKLANVGYYDNSCIMYTGYDTRLNPSLGVYPLTGTPLGDFDDFFSIPMDLSSFTDTCNLNFLYSAATRSSNSIDINDTLEIDYSTNRSLSWAPLKYLSKSSLINKGSLSIPYAPLYQGDWAPQTVGIPAAARSNYVIFRFRYRPNVTAPDAITGQTYSSGNNFYMDRINFSRTPASVSSVKLNSMDVAVVPNPTNSDAYVVIKDVNNATAQVNVTDITGEVVYTTSQQVNGETHVLIPHSAISVPGLYMVQTVTGSQVRTQKLVVE